MERKKFESILLMIIRIGLFSVVFIPLIFSSKLFFPFIVMKDVVFRVLVEFLFFTYILLVIQNQKYLPKVNMFVMAVFSYFSIITITSFFGIDIYYSFWGNYERMGGLFRMWHVFMYFIVLISIFREEKYWNTLFTLSIASSTIMAFFSLAQKLGVPFILPSSGGDRLTGTIGNAIYLAAYMLFHIFFILYFFIHDRKFNIKMYLLAILGADILLILFDIYMGWRGATTGIIQQLVASKNLFIPIIIFHITLITVWFFKEMRLPVKCFLSLLFVLETAIVIWTQTRGAAIGLYFGVLTAIILGFIVYFRSFARKWFLVGMIILIASPFLLYIFRESSFVQSVPILQRLSGISPFSPDDITTQARILTWTSSLKGWIEDPARFLFGYGLENYYYVFNKNYPSEIYRDAGSQIWFDRAHNIVLDVGISSGIIGLINYLGMITIACVILYAMYKIGKNTVLMLIFIPLFITYFFQNLFVFDTMDSYILFYSVMGFVAFVSFALEDKHFFTKRYLKNIFHGKEIESAFNAKLYQTAFVAVCILFVFSVYYFNIRLVKANRILYVAIRSSMDSPKKYKKNMAMFENAIESAVTGRYEARQQLLEYTMNAKSLKLPDKELRLMVENIEEELKKSIEESPKDVRHYLMLVMLYNKYSSLIPSYNERALEVSKKALELSPTRSQIYFAIGEAYFNQGKKNLAVEYLEQGVALAPYAHDLHYMLAEAYGRTGKFLKAEKELDYLIENFLEIGMSDDHMKQIIDLYEVIGKYDKMIAMLDNLLRLFPNTTKADYFAKYAMAYARKGENEKAEQYIKKVLEFAPERKGDIQIFLDNLRQGKYKNSSSQ